MQPARWFDRRFELGLGPGAAPELIERLSRTPERLAAVVRDLPHEVLTWRREGKWSIQENLGHLADLEPLWQQRLADYADGATELHPADLENRKTHEAGHNDRALAEILEEFTALRAGTLAQVKQLSETELARTAVHPRLRQPMSVVDLCFFVAEHDDHHLRTIEELRAAVPTTR